MFEYIAKNDKKVTINPKMITVIMESDTPNETIIYTVESPDPIRVQETYEKVSETFKKFNYQIDKKSTRPEVGFKKDFKNYNTNLRKKIF